MIAGGMTDELHDSFGCDGERWEDYQGDYRVLEAFRTIMREPHIWEAFADDEMMRELLDDPSYANALNMP